MLKKWLQSFCVEENAKTPPQWLDVVQQVELNELGLVCIVADAEFKMIACLSNHALQEFSQKRSMDIKHAGKILCRKYQLKCQVAHDVNLCNVVFIEEFDSQGEIVDDKSEDLPFLSSNPQALKVINKRIAKTYAETPLNFILDEMKMSEEDKAKADQLKGWETNDLNTTVLTWGFSPVPSSQPQQQDSQMSRNNTLLLPSQQTIDNSFIPVHRIVATQETEQVEIVSSQEEDDLVQNKTDEKKENSPSSPELTKPPERERNTSGTSNKKENTNCEENEEESKQKVASDDTLSDTIKKHFENNQLPNNEDVDFAVHVNVENENEDEYCAPYFTRPEKGKQIHELQMKWFKLMEESDSD